MPDHFVEALAVPVACCHCGYLNRKRIEAIKGDLRITCSSCDGSFYVDNRELEREVVKLAGAGDGFVRRLRAKKEWCLNSRLTAEAAVSRPSHACRLTRSNVKA